MPYRGIELPKMKPVTWVPDDYFIDYIGLLGNPENFVWTPEEESRAEMPGPARY